jgi:hypothetical protein
LTAICGGNIAFDSEITIKIARRGRFNAIKRKRDCLYQSADWNIRRKIRFSCIRRRRFERKPPRTKPDLGTAPLLICS